jgi:D-galacturonate reductase
MSQAKRQRTEGKEVSLPSCLLIGTGEYTTGYVHGAGSASDKTVGVVGLTFFDLRSRGKVGERIALCGTSGRKFPGLRKHLKAGIEDKYAGLTVDCDTYPEDDKTDAKAYLTAIKSLSPGDIAVVTTPDDTHFDITMACIEAGLHVMVTKPLVKTLKEHVMIAAAAKKHNVLVCLEFHKRYDPIYNDAVNRIRTLGDFGFFQSYMSQPKFQLQTFKAWAGKSSDISYYLNSHHIDIHEFACGEFAKPVRVSAVGSKGVCQKEIGVDAEDTITVTATWENNESKNVGTAVYTASWATPRTDVHSEQQFFYIGHAGQMKLDQAHRGFLFSDDKDGFKSVNPLYMRYTPDAQGRFVGQQGYGYKSFEVFVDAVADIRAGKSVASDFDYRLPTAESTMFGTAILEGGRLSLDNDNNAFEIVYENGKPVSLRQCTQRV